MVISFGTYNTLLFEKIPLDTAKVRLTAIITGYETICGDQWVMSKSAVAHFLLVVPLLEKIIGTARFMNVKLVGTMNHIESIQIVLDSGLVFTQTRKVVEGWVREKAS